MTVSVIRPAALKATLLAIVLCFSMPALADSHDPYERVNRGIFAFNEFADKWFLKPVATGYRWITPQFVDNGVSNVFNNLAEIRNTLNSGLQGEFSHAGISFGRFLVNSTIGVAGIFDVASHIGMQHQIEDFGQTLGVWGVGPGPYVMLPFLGPSNLRDAFSLIPDTYVYPPTYMNDISARNWLRALEEVDDRADLIDVEQLISGDRYVFLRDVYLLSRESEVNNGAVEDDFGDDF